MSFKFTDCLLHFLGKERYEVEPLGVHPHFHQLGLGRILLLEMLHRFKEHGATRAIVETTLDRSPARHAYESVGFQQIHIIGSSRKLLNQPA